MTEEKSARERIKKAIETVAFIRNGAGQIIWENNSAESASWIFDLRAILMQSAVMHDIATLFWERFAKDAPLQIGCMESGGIPLMSSLVALASDHEVPSCNGFFIRKSRKKKGLLKGLEGTLDENKIILVDDLINSGKSLMRQVEVIEERGLRVHAIWCVVRFRDPSEYEYFQKKHIAIHSLFELNDFSHTLGVKNLVTHPPKASSQEFSIRWKFSSPQPAYQHVVAKSSIALDDERLYFGSDSGIFWALNQSDGSVAWSHKVGFHPKGKGILSSPAVHDGTVFFGAYDGNVYALDAKTGRKKWISFEADWVGSSPALAPEIDTLFIGLEFGLWKKRGGIIALDMKTGAKRWQYTMPSLTHSSPLYIKEYQQVVIGCNDGVAYCFDAKSGALQWKFETGILNQQESESGFSRFDIKGSVAYDAKRDLVIVANMDGGIFFLERASGKSRGTFRTEFGLYSTPVVSGDTVLLAALDKQLHCVDLDTFTEKWNWSDGTRIFATPLVSGNEIFLGSNGGRLTAIDFKTGKEKTFIAFTERITNKIAHNPDSNQLFVSTYANEVYCLEREEKNKEKNSK